MQGKADLISNNNNNKTAGLPAKKLNLAPCTVGWCMGQEKEKKSNISTLGVAQQNSCSICVRRG